jgi:hypothetical protein
VKSYISQSQNNSQISYLTSEYKSSSKTKRTFPLVYVNTVRIKGNYSMEETKQQCLGAATNWHKSERFLKIRAVYEGWLSLLI